MTDLHNRYHALPVSELTGQALDDDERLGAGKQVQYPVSPEEMNSTVTELRELRAERDAALARVAELETEAKSESAWADEYHNKLQAAESEVERLTHQLNTYRVGKPGAPAPGFKDLPHSPEYYQRAIWLRNNATDSQLTEWLLNADRKQKEAYDLRIENAELRAQLAAVHERAELGADLIAWAARPDFNTPTSLHVRARALLAKEQAAK